MLPAALQVSGRPNLTGRRPNIAVMIDDLVTRGGERAVPDVYLSRRVSPNASR